jgi:histidine triad (HIT) family protein
MSTAYDPQNVFAKILRSEIPCHKIYEDEHILAFMDIMPRVDGHCLVIPKAPSRGLLDAEPEDLATVMAAVQKVGRAAVQAFGADGLTVQQFNEEAGGQVVFHLHFHILPRKAGEAMKPPGGPMAPGDLLAAHAAKIRAALD